MNEITEIGHRSTQKPIGIFTEFRDRNVNKKHKGKRSPQKAFVTGWGRCDWTGNELCLPRSSVFFPDERLDPMLRTISFDHAALNTSIYCVGYEKHMIRLHSAHGMLCAGPAREAEPLAPCLAAPGAPLAVLGALAGLLSWGFGCGYSHDLPLVYTDLRFYTHWIRNNLKILDSLNSDEVSELYIASKAYVIQEWLVLTSGQRPAEVPRGDKQIRAADLDDHLVELAGDVRDFRDYAYGGVFHSQKAELYTALKSESNKKRLYAEVSAEFMLKKQKLQPFLGKSLHDAIDNFRTVSHKHTNKGK